MAKNTVTKIKGLIPVKRVLISLSDKTGLNDFVGGLIEASPEVVFYSSTGTHRAIAGFLGDNVEKHLVDVGEFTGYREMPGGLVKTLHPAVHAGILGERLNPDHQDYLREIHSDYFDMVACNLYPFEETVKASDYTYEKARGNIDIGGPTMIRGAAKNWHSCAAVCDPSDYLDIIQNVSLHDGCTTSKMRFRLMQTAFGHTAKYDVAIAGHMVSQKFEDVIDEYTPV